MPHVVEHFISRVAIGVMSTESCILFLYEGLRVPFRSMISMCHSRTYFWILMKALPSRMGVGAHSDHLCDLQSTLSTMMFGNFSDFRIMLSSRSWAIATVVEGSMTENTGSSFVRMGLSTPLLESFAIVPRTLLDAKSSERINRFKASSNDSLGLELLTELFSNFGTR